VRRYCSRCLQTLGALDPDRCPGTACRTPRPGRGWPSFLTEGTTISERFIVREILGAGGAGITYRCEDLVENGDSALKVLHDDRRHGVLANRLAIEGELLELLVHKHIVPFHALRLVGEGPVYLATAYMPGGSLEGTLRRGGPLDGPTVLEVGRQLALALDFIHSQGIVHRDLKPGNVLIERSEPTPVVRLADFGIARVFRDQRVLPGPMGLTRTGVFIGTPEYAAPEQIRGEKGIGPAADAFALGALLHYAASGDALLKRSEIADWSAFRARRRDPSERPRLRDVTPAGLAVGHRAELEELDAIIDALMHPDADARVSLADVALAMGAAPSELAPRDLTPLAPRTLVSALDDGWFNDDGVDALVPRDDDDAIDEAAAIADLPNLADLTGLDATPTPAEPEIDQSLSGDPTIVVPRRATVPPPSSSLAVPPPSNGALPDPDPNSVPEWDDDEIDWPSPRKRRRNRLHAAVLGLAAMAAGIALAWPGGVPALIGDDAMDGLAEPVRDVVDQLATAAPTYTASSPWDGKRVLTGSAPVAHEPVDVKTVAVRPAPKQASAIPVAAKAASPARKPRTSSSSAPSEPTRSRTPQPVATAPARVVPQPARTTPQPAPAPVEEWARTPADERELPDVVREQVGRAHAEWIEDLVDRYDERARRYEESARNDAIRRAALFRAWDRQVEDAHDLVRGDDRLPDGADDADCASVEEDEVASAGR